MDDENSTVHEPVTRGRLALALATGLPLCPRPPGALPEPMARPEQALSAEPEPYDPDGVLIRVAEMLGWPMRQVQVAAQAGRFLRVHYTPVVGHDPDLVVCMATGVDAARCNAALADFQAARRAVYRNPAAWYAQARQAARALLGPLYALHPTPAEADFVLRWAMVTVAGGHTVQDGIRPRDASITMMP